ncbi:unnamed protein product [Symbiodinium sp. CCMP2592]|nr:unnamed protein product [Symbiodinium sp. CCMP2592]
MWMSGIFRVNLLAIVIHTASGRLGSQDVKFGGLVLSPTQPLFANSSVRVTSGACGPGTVPGSVYPVAEGREIHKATSKDWRWSDIGLQHCAGGVETCAYRSDYGPGAYWCPLPPGGSAADKLLCRCEQCPCQQGMGGFMCSNCLEDSACGTGRCSTSRVVTGAQDKTFTCNFSDSFRSASLDFISNMCSEHQPIFGCTPLSSPCVKCAECHCDFPEDSYLTDTTRTVISQIAAGLVFSCEDGSAPVVGRATERLATPIGSPRVPSTVGSSLVTPVARDAVEPDDRGQALMINDGDENIKTRRTRDECSNGAVNQHRFLDAAKAGNFSQVRNMLTESPELINCQPGGRWSALHHAAYKVSCATEEVLTSLALWRFSPDAIPRGLCEGSDDLQCHICLDDFAVGDELRLSFAQRAFMMFGVNAIPFTLAASTSGCKRRADAVTCRKTQNTAQVQVLAAEPEPRSMLFMYVHLETCCLRYARVFDRTSSGTLEALRVVTTELCEQSPARLRSDVSERHHRLRRDCWKSRPVRRSEGSSGLHYDVDIGIVVHAHVRTMLEDGRSLAGSRNRTRAPPFLAMFLPLPDTRAQRRTTTEPQRQRQRESEILAQATSAQGRAAPSTARGSLFFPLLLRGGRSQTRALLFSCLSRLSHQRPGGHSGQSALFFEGVRDGDIVGTVPRRGRRPTCSCFGSLTPATATISAALQDLAGLPSIRDTIHLERGHQHLPDRDSGTQGDLAFLAYVWGS